MNATAREHGLDGIFGQLLTQACIFIPRLYYYELQQRRF